MADFVLLHHQFVGPQAVEQSGIVVQGAGNSGGQSPLFGVRGAAHAAVTQVPAAFDVAWDHLPGPAQRLATLAQDVVVHIRLGQPGLNVMSLLAAVEPGLHGCRGQVVEPETAGPVIQRRCRCTEAGRPVHCGRAAHTPALKNGDCSVFGDPAHAFLVEGGIGVQLVHFEVFLVIQTAFFHQNHRQPGFRQNLRRGAAPGAGADDHHIGFVGLVLCQGGAVGDLPASLKPTGDTIR